MASPGVMESTLKYRPSSSGILTGDNSGHCLVGSLTGVVTSERVTEVSQGPLTPDGNRRGSAIAEAGLTVRHTGRSGAKAGYSDPVVSVWKGHRSKDKRYAGDNRLISPKSSHRRGGLAPRCRLVTSWGWRRFQGLGCSPIKVARELGSERRETVRSLSVVGVGILMGSVLSTRGPGWTNRWCAGCLAAGMAG